MILVIVNNILSNFIYVFKIFLIYNIKYWEIIFDLAGPNYSVQLCHINISNQGILGNYSSLWWDFELKRCLLPYHPERARSHRNLKGVKQCGLVEKDVKFWFTLCWTFIGPL